MLALIVYQVPQPWRGILIGWLLFFFTVGLIAMRVVRAVMDYKTAKILAGGETKAKKPETPRRVRSAFESLPAPVVQASRGNGGRETVD
jgi:hypothetical protein